MASTIKLKRGSGAPSGGSLAAGEPALDLTNNKLYSSTDGTDVVEIGSFNGQFADGTVAAPSITFSADPDTGFSRTATGVITYSSDGARQITFDDQHTYFTTTANSDGIPSSTERYVQITSGQVGLSGITYANSLFANYSKGLSSQFGSSGYYFGYFEYDGIQRGAIIITASGTSYNTLSDYRLKENVVPIENAVARIDSLNPVRFNFTSDPTKTVDGFLAHEVTPVVPEAITGEKDAVDADGNPVYQGIDQAKLVPLLVAAVQELSARVAELEAS
jgi:hypothetical protein